MCRLVYTFVANMQQKQGLFQRESVNNQVINSDKQDKHFSNTEGE